MGDNEFRPADLIAAVYEAIIGEAVRQHNNTPPATLVLTHPVAWTDARLAVLGDAVDIAAGGLGIELPEPVFLPEPVAAAAHYARPTSGRHDEDVTSLIPVGGEEFLVVYDLGGGTFDATVLRHEGSEFEVLASGGIDPLGGFDLDSRLLNYLGTRHCEPVAADLWRTYSAPEPFDHAAGARRRALEIGVRQLREDLSAQNQQTIRMPGLAEEVLVTRNELESVIRADIEATIEELRATVDRAGLTMDQVACVYRIGGAARTPLVGSLLDQLHRPVRVVDHPKTVVCLGAAAPDSRDQPPPLATLATVEVEVPRPAPRPEPPPRPGWRPTVPDWAVGRKASHQTVAEGGPAPVHSNGTLAPPSAPRTDPYPTPTVGPIDVGATAPVQYVAPIQGLVGGQIVSIPLGGPGQQAPPAGKSYPSPRIPYIIAGVLAVLAVVFAVVAEDVSAHGVGFQPGTLIVAGVDPATGQTPVVDLTQPVPIAVPHPDGDAVVMELDVLGVRLLRRVERLSPGGTVAMPPPVHPLVLAGKLTGIVTVIRGDVPTATYRFTFQTRQPAYTTAFAISTLVVGLFALGFLESGLRALRQARRRAGAFVTVVISAASLAVVGLTAAWILTGRLPSTEALLGSTELAAASGVALSIAVGRAGRAKRGRRR
ncbi:Hsp70 family protein [Mycobacterium sp. 360MFTsu5.1]|uniref:Hsp70 family protein n=1 Tax=Mycobacterium sp. 360MFTsu5.1 TaxID=1172186 RepID=UPI0018CA67C5|nr:Hsp70 family protein [Mycobacterium sp. 360MFTsu5.1]